MTQRAPEGSTPMSTLVLGSRESWMTIFSSATIFSPSLPTSSSFVVGRWKPVATRRVISILGLPSRSSASMKGMMCLLGTGRVWSLIIIVAVFLPLASSHSRGESTGSAIAFFTMSSSLPIAFRSPMEDSRTSTLGIS
ncbi:hypothetical protein SDC9_197393 [bioreactor metagenome]|uniref:Uncharacterized protein n=1 Tax=bioreactor metagenome TaxID=1076179 RepID=A0A645IEM0_9ZZZZ